ncbi:hypothetical protein ABZZ79_07495 [Streptomyces sp. NPDC006458]|uniref:PKD domain-containing protein n=1 Tax=Streptomyces sp. NPDC006458 TaxID=3154302 RepID=UPI0033BD5C80
MSTWRASRLLAMLVALVVATTLHSPAAAEGDEIPWTWRMQSGSWRPCLTIAPAGLTAVFSWDQGVDGCAPKDSFAVHSFRVWGVRPSYWTVYEQYPEPGPYEVTMPGEGLYVADATYSDPPNSWHPNSHLWVTVGKDSDGDFFPDSADVCPSVPASPEQSSGDGCPPLPDNTAPVVSAGADITLKGQAGTALHGTVSDDGLPKPARITTSWSKVSGPGTVKFAARNQTRTTVTFGAAGTYVLRLSASDGELSARDEVKVKVVEHYRVEIRAWIPHPKVVDPVHPKAQALVGNTPDSYSACGALSGPMVQSSTFRGDDHRTFSSGSDGYRGRSWAEFDWDGTGVTGLKTTTDPVQLFGTTHRDFVIKRPGLPDKKCTAKRRVTKTSTVKVIRDGAGVHLDLATRNPLVDPSPNIDSDLDVWFPTPGRLQFQARTDLFPSHGVRIWRNGTAFYTRTTHQAACVNALGVQGAANLLDRLTHQTNSRTLLLDINATPKSVDESC